MVLYCEETVTILQEYFALKTLTLMIKLIAGIDQCV